MKEKWGKFGARIRYARVDLGLSQGALAKVLNIDTTTVWRWEKGERRPKQKGLLALSRVLGIRIQALQSLAGYTPEFDWYNSFSAEPNSQDDILLDSSEDEKESLRQYLHFLRFRDQVKSSK